MLMNHFVTRPGLGEFGDSAWRLSIATARRPFALSRTFVHAVLKRSSPVGSGRSSTVSERRTRHDLPPLLSESRLATGYRGQPNEPDPTVTTLRTAWTKVRDRAKVVGRWHDNRHALGHRTRRVPGG